MAHITKDNIDIFNSVVQIQPVPINTEVGYEFKGVNRNHYPVQLRQSPGCGCTKAEAGELTVAPGAEFSLKGKMTGRHTKQTYTKSVTVYYAGPGQKTDSNDRTIYLQFTGKAE